MANFGPLTLRSVYQFGAPQQILTGFASWLHYYSDVAHRRPPKLCRIFGRLLCCYYIYILRGSCPLTEFCHVQNSQCVQVLRSPIYWQRCCTALQQWALAKLCGVVQGMELQNFRRGRQIYSAGRPSRWASAHILVTVALWNRADHYIFALWFLLLCFFLSSFFSSPNLSRRIGCLRTSKHGVTLVRI